MKVGVLVSGGGSNLQAIIDAVNAGKIKNCELSVVVSSSESAYALKRAQNANIPTECVVRRKCENGDDFCNKIADILESYNVELIVLAILNEDFVKRFENRIINIHPSLIPSFCGKGYYGLAVHEAVLKKGVKITGATVHFVNEIPDGGAIILQKAVSVLDNDTPQILQARVMERAEWIILPMAVDLLCNNKITIKDGKTIVLD